MAIKINFDSANIPEEPTLILANRRGNKIGKINAQNIVIKDDMVNGAEITFTVNKYLNNEQDYLWNQIKDYKLVWCKECDLWFQIKVDIDEELSPVKNISCVQLAQAELSQIILYDIEINTENDIARDDYINPTVLYNQDNHSISLLHRITEKAPHYQIVHVDPTIANIQRTFSFDDISIYDACSEIAEEIGCIFIFQSDSDENGNIRRGISVYDVQSYCTKCGERGHFTHVCTKCGSSDILEGYGEDTTIFITADELGKDIKFTSDTDSQKNCFKLEAGDDLMTATIRSCNPNGSDYIWYIPDYIKEDMSDDLVQKINEYDNLYEYYQKEYLITIDQNLLNEYNQLIDEYRVSKTDLTPLSSPIVGYGNLMIAYYQNIDFAMYLQSEMMPTVEPIETNAEKEVAKLSSFSISPVAVTNIDSVSLATADNAVLSVAKCLVNANYRIKVTSSSLNKTTWEGIFYVENYSDEDDNATSAKITVRINANYEDYVNQKIQKALSQENQEKTDITGLFAKDISDFKSELKKYNLDSLNSFQNICQSCIDILVEQGVATNQTWGGNNLYEKIYKNYYNKLKAIENEQNIRQNEIYIITGKYDNDVLIQHGLQSILNEHRANIQKNLDFENFLGLDLWLEFCAYKREDKFSNSNYISDGLNNTELFEKALEFIDTAQKELYTSAELQHSITASLLNLLVIPKFKIITQYFKVGNWIRILVDDNVYKLRLINYEIDYSNLDDMSVEFSDVTKTADGYSDQQSLMQSMSNMATSYSYTQHQAEQGEKSKQTISHWVEKGLDVTNNKIINGASNQTQTWDEHGILCRQYNDILDEYDNCQLKIINSTLAVTDDNWLNVKTAIGKYYYIDPETNEVKYAYGVNGDTIVGRLILGEQLGIYNETGSMKFDSDGFTVKNDKNIFNVNPNSTNLLTISKTVNNTTESIFYVDENGTLHIKGDGSALDITANNSITDATSRITQTETDITAIVSRNDKGAVVSLDCEKVRVAWNDVDQYIQFDKVSNRAGLSIYNSSEEKERILRLDNQGLNINNNSGNALIKLNTTGLNLYGKYTNTNDDNTYLLMSLNSTGQTYYYKKYSMDNNPFVVGKIGTNSWVGDSKFRGLYMGLNYGGSYLALSHQDKQNGNYNVKIVYYAENSTRGNKGIHLCDVTYLDNNIWLNENVRTIRYDSGDAGIYSATHGVSLEGTTALVSGSDGSFKIEDGAFNLYNSTNRLVNCYNNLDMHNYAINNAIINSSSDVRMKTNIIDSEINAVNILNQIEMKSFDWRTDNKHEDIGIIAQQLQEILPDLVYEDELTTKLSIQPIKFIPYLIKAIQELSAKIDGGSKSKTKNKFKSDKKYSFSEKEVDEFLKRIKSKSTPDDIQEQGKEIIKFTPIYLENQFKNQERKGNKNE